MVIIIAPHKADTIFITVNPSIIDDTNQNNNTLISNPNKPNDNILKGIVITFNIGLIAKFINANTIAAIIAALPPETDIPEMKYGKP